MENNNLQNSNSILSSSNGANAIVGRSAVKKWLTLNQHGKDCLQTFISALSASDLKTSQLDYLFNKELIDYSLNYVDAEKRILLAGHCLTDLGVETVKHYFPNY